MQFNAKNGLDLLFKRFKDNIHSSTTARWYHLQKTDYEIRPFRVINTHTSIHVSLIPTSPNRNLRAGFLYLDN